MKKAVFPVTIFGKIISVILALYIVLPLIFLILFSFSARIEVIPSELTLRWYLFNPDVVLGAVINTMRISIPSVLLSALISILLSLAVARMKFKGSFFVEQLIALPMILPGTVLGLALLQVANSALFTRIPAVAVLIMAHVIVTLPVISRPIIAALRQSGTHAEEASKTLGATPLRTFLTVTLPIISSSVFVGMLLGFARSITDFVMTLFIVPPHMVPMSIHIFNATHLSIQQIASANATVLLVFTIVVVAIAERVMIRSKKTK